MNDALPHEFVTAIQNGELDRVREMLGLDPELIESTSLGDCPLVEACYSRHPSSVDIAQLILESATDPKTLVNMRDSQGCTALRWASAHRNRALVELLFSYGADVDERSALSLSAMDTASGAKDTEDETPLQVKKVGGCYVATACYGDYDHPDVRVFRRFRDEVLLACRPGRAFVAGYYRFGPAVATRIGHVEWLAHLVRRLVLEPLARRLRCREGYRLSVGW